MSAPQSKTSAKAPAKAPGATPKTTVEFITVEMAGQYLAKSVGNRTIRKVSVKKYARDILGDGTTTKWRLNGEAIKFDTEGNFVDGHHRMHAIIMAGRGVQMTVTRGIDPESVLTLDTGIGRNFSDWSVIGGRSYGSMVGTVAKWWAAYENMATGRGSQHITTGHNPYTMQEIESIVLAHPAIAESCAFILGKRVLKRKSSSILAFVHAYCSEQFDRDMADLFINDLDSGAALKEGSPILALRRKIVDEAGVGRRMEQSYTLACVIKAWNAWVEGQTVRRITWRSGTNNSEAFPRFGKAKVRALTAMREREIGKKSQSDDEG